MAVLVLDGCEMDTDILNDDSRFTEFMTDFFRDKEQHTIRIWDIPMERNRRLLEIVENAGHISQYNEALEIATSFNQNSPEEESSSMGVWKRHVRKNRTKAGAGREG